MKNQKSKRLLKSQVAAIAGVCVLGIGSIGVVAAIHHNWSRGMNGAMQANDVQKQQLTDEGGAFFHNIA